MRRCALVVAMLVLAGCSAAAKPASVSREPVSAASGPPARVDEAALMRAHPFAEVVAQLDNDIATLNATRSGGLSAAGTSIAKNRAMLQAQLGNAATRAREMNVSPPALRHAEPAASGELSTPQAIALYQSALSDRLNRAVALREAQFHEKEATVDYQFDRAHAGQRLRLGLRLHSPYLDAGAKRSIQAQLDALNAQEDHVVQAQRAMDAVELARFRATLQEDASTQLASMQRDLQRHQAAVAKIPQPSDAVVARAESIPSRTDKLKTAAAFAQASQELSARFDRLHDWNGGAASSVQQEVAQLQTERNRLASEMRTQIEAEAQRIARERGLGPVYTSAAPAGATDLTRDVAAALEQLRGRS